MRRTAIVVAATVLCVGWPTVSGAVARDIERATATAQDAYEDSSAGGHKPSGLEASRHELAAAIERGQVASGQLRAQIASLEAEKDALEEQKASLERVQVALASGLVAALATAGVATFGALANRRRSASERDLKRLEVLEKTYDLRAKGVPLPGDLLKALEGVGPGAG